MLQVTSWDGYIVKYEGDHDKGGWDGHLAGMEKYEKCRRGSG